MVGGGFTSSSGRGAVKPAHLVREFGSDFGRGVHGKNSKGVRSYRKLVRQWVLCEDEEYRV